MVKCTSIARSIITEAIPITTVPLCLPHHGSSNVTYFQLERKLRTELCYDHKDDLFPLCSFNLHAKPAISTSSSSPGSPPDLTTSALANFIRNCDLSTTDSVADESPAAEQDEETNSDPQDLRFEYNHRLVILYYENPALFLTAVIPRFGINIRDATLNLLKGFQRQFLSTPHCDIYNDNISRRFSFRARYPYSRAF